jgi:hypothetical protein
MLDSLSFADLPFADHPSWLGIVVLVLIAAGTIKGITGLGLPIVGLPLLAMMIDLKSAIQLMSITMVTSNFGQLNAGGHVREAARRYLPLTLCCVGGIFLGTFALTSLPPWVSYIVGGMLLMLAGANFLWKIRLVMPPRVESIASPVLGLVFGILGGMSGIFGPFVIFYLSLIEHDKHRFVAAISLMLLGASSALLAAQILVAGMSWTWIIASAIAVIPVQAGIMIGDRIRRHMPQEAFRKLMALFVIGMGALYFARAMGI